MSEPMRILSLGAGVQSTALAYMSLRGELPALDAIIFADTQNEPAHVYETVYRLAEACAAADGPPLLLASRGNLLADIYGSQEGSGRRFVALPLYTYRTYAERRHGEELVSFRQPAQLRRQCTKEYKIEIVRRALLRFLLARGLARRRSHGKIYALPGVAIEQWLGISYDEVGRMRASDVGYITHRWPLIEARTTRQDCIAWFEARGLAVPGASACIICPYRSAASWRAMAEQQPDEFSAAVAFDEALRANDGRLRIAATAANPLYLHDSRQPLAELVKESGDDGEQLPLFCDSGYCGV